MSLMLIRGDTCEGSRILCEWLLLLLLYGAYMFRTVGQKFCLNYTALISSLLSVVLPAESGASVSCFGRDNVINGEILESECSNFG